ncbi:MAG: hypothetical protein HQ518_27615 [Rhodopirellula sp.]|nr:hypothetical protein [Rhodopirellula sp.]
MFILNTDHLWILQRQRGQESEALSHRIQQRAESRFFLTIISFQEQIQGWNAYIARAKDEDSVAQGYGKLEGILS